MKAVFAGVVKDTETQVSSMMMCLDGAGGKESQLTVPQRDSKIENMMKILQVLVNVKRRDFLICVLVFSPIFCLCKEDLKRLQLSGINIPLPSSRQFRS
jgi:hypothetical protein